MNAHQSPTAQTAPEGAQITRSLIEFVAEIDRLIDASKPSTHLWNYCVWNRKAVIREAVKYDMGLRKVLAHHELMPGRVAANTEDLLADLTACNSHAALTASNAELRRALEEMERLATSELWNTFVMKPEFRAALQAARAALGKEAK